MAKKSVTQIESIVEAARRGEKIWVGVDVHTKKYAVAILSESIDCRRLAELAAKNELKGIYVPTEEEEARRALVRRREKLKRSLARIKTQIKSFLTCHNLPHPGRAWSGAFVADLSKLASGLDRGLRETLESMLSELDYFDKEKNKVTEESKKIIIPPKGDVLQSVPGVGPITAVGFRSEVIDPKRFESGEELSSFVGLAPMVRQSGESRGRSHLVPSGQGALRSQLIEAAWTLRSKEPWATDVYNRIYKRSGNFQKAITALARKLAVILWRLWLENRVYDPNYQSAVPNE